MLTGKAKEEFEKWTINRLKKVADLPSETLIDGFYSTELTFQLAYAVEWFDSVKIYIQNWATKIEDKIEFDSDVNHVKMHSAPEFHKTRQDAITWAVIKANEIYNSQRKEKP